MQTGQSACHRIWTLLENSSATRRIIVFCLDSLVGLWVVGRIPVAIEIQMQTNESGVLQIFYSAGGGYNERQSKKVPLSAALESMSYRVLVANADIHELRIDSLQPHANVHVESSAGGLIGQSTGIHPRLSTDSLGFFRPWRVRVLSLAALVGGLLMLPFASALLRHNRSKIVTFVGRIFSNPGYVLFLILLLASVMLNARSSDKDRRIHAYLAAPVAVSVTAWFLLA